MQQNNHKSPIILLSLSAAFEYYDFVIYGLMATYLGPLFFPNDNVVVSQLQAFAVFSLGYLVRPLGGMILGALADMTNRKLIFIRSNVLLALATLGISILPSYDNIGISATILIILLRTIQSFSFAAEIPGAMAIIKDNQQDPSKSFGFIVSSAAIGSILASGTLYLLEYNFSKAEILSFAWRIPFAFGAILCLISFLMRKNLPNLAQIKLKNKRKWIASLLKEYQKIVACVLVIAISAYLILMNLFFPSFLPKFYGYQAQEIYLSISISLMWAAIYAPIFAHLTAKIARITLLQVIIVIAMFIGLLIHFFLLQGKIILALCLYQSLISNLMVISFPLMAEIFSSNNRFTLMAICYNVSYALISFSPILITNIATELNGPFIMWIALIFLSILALANLKALFSQEDL